MLEKADEEKNGFSIARFVYVLCTFFWGPLCSFQPSEVKSGEQFRVKHVADVVLQCNDWQSRTAPFSQEAGGLCEFVFVCVSKHTVFRKRVGEWPTTKTGGEWIQVSSILCSDWLSASLSQNPVKVFRQNTSFFTTTYIPHHPVIMQHISHTKCSHFNFILLLQRYWNTTLPYSWWVLVEQLDDITTVKNYVISTGHAAFYHDPVPACHLEQKKDE